MKRFFEVTLCLIALVILLGYLTPIFYKLVGIQISSDPAPLLERVISTSANRSVGPF